MFLLAKIVGGALLVAVVAYLLFPRGSVSTAEAHRLVDAGALLLDVRTRDEFSAGHVAGALNVPVQELEQRVDELGSRARPIVVYCRSGQRSGRAKVMLAAAGFESVHDLGAMSRW